MKNLNFNNYSLLLYPLFIDLQIAAANVNNLKGTNSF